MGAYVNNTMRILEVWWCKYADWALFVLKYLPLNILHFDLSSFRSFVHLSPCVRERAYYVLAMLFMLVHRSSNGKEPQ